MGQQYCSKTLEVMKKLVIVLSLFAFVYIARHISLLLHNLSPSLEVVEREIPMTNLEVKQAGYQVKANRSYYRKVVYEERRQTKGLHVEVQRDTTSNAVVYEEDK
jgi:hypothetical protein